jgi:hypothetical protein
MKPWRAGQGVGGARGIGPSMAALASAEGGLWPRSCMLHQTLASKSFEVSTQTKVSLLNQIQPSIDRQINKMIVYN